jgi:hypothetical protein
MRIPPWAAESGKCRYAEDPSIVGNGASEGLDLRGGLDDPETVT